MILQLSIISIIFSIIDFSGSGVTPAAKPKVVEVVKEVVVEKIVEAHEDAKLKAGQLHI